VLCVTPRFAPANGADAHRVRLLVAHLKALHCDVEVLAVDPGSAGMPVEPALMQGVPADLPVHRVRAWPLSGWGLNGLAQRAIVPLYSRGLELLRSRRFDLVFFSTTEFLLHTLGPLWRWRTGVPFCMDYQDPWVSEYYDATGTAPPGGRIKFRVVQLMHRAAERFVAPRCAGFVAVSARYVDDVRKRYAGLANTPELIAPFPADANLAQAAPATAKTDHPVWRYIGRGGPDLAKAAGAFFDAWRAAVSAGLAGANEVRMEIIGTSYAGEGQGVKTLQPIAARRGIDDRVTENPDRIPYGRAMELLASSDALAVFGSDDTSYTASKLFPYLMARRPLLAIFHERSPAAALLRAVRGCTLVTFSSDEPAEAVAQRVLDAWFAARAFEHVLPIDEAQLAPYLAPAQARDLLQLFDKAIAHAR
jgi:hypothetical protein